MNNSNSEKPLIGFVAWFPNFGETSTLTTIAKKYIEQGGKVIFFGFGKTYQHLATDLGCPVIILDYNFSEKLLKKDKVMQKKFDENKMQQESLLLHPLYKENYKCDLINIKNKIEAFKESNIKLIITGFDSLSNISARVLNIPLVYVVSGAAIAPYYKQNLASFPDNYENFLTRLVPSFIKNRLSNWFVFNNSSSVKEFNRLAKAYNVTPIKHLLDFYTGDYTLVAEDIAFLNLKPTAEFPIKNFIGPIFPEIISVKKEEDSDAAVKKHLQRSGKSILVSLGSSGTKELFIKILRVLEKTDYNVIAVHTTIFFKQEIPKFKDNILLVQFVSSIKNVNESVDVAIIHGGRGTVYTAAYAGKPVIGIPMQLEQQYNIDNLVRHKTAIRISKKRFAEKDLLKALDKIFTNYDTFLKNAQLLKEKLKEPKGAENAVKRILEIIENKKI